MLMPFKSNPSSKPDITIRRAHYQIFARFSVEEKRSGLFVLSAPAVGRKEPRAKPAESRGLQRFAREGGESVGQNG
jgi:hypothetical protein